jgi:hypothetical protein
MNAAASRFFINNLRHREEQRGYRNFEIEHALTAIHHTPRLTCARADNWRDPNEIVRHGEVGAHPIMRFVPDEQPAAMNASKKSNSESSVLDLLDLLTKRDAIDFAAV